MESVVGMATGTQYRPMFCSNIAPLKQILNMILNCKDNGFLFLLKCGWEGGGGRMLPDIYIRMGDASNAIWINGGRGWYGN